MIVQIDGWYGSGKSVLKGLLDGHKEVFSNPIHDIIPLAFSNENDVPKWLEYKDTEHLRKLLASNSSYFRLERFANAGKFPFDFSTTDRIYFDFNFDFYQFDKMVFNQLNNSPIWSFDYIVQVIYTHLQTQLNDQSKILTKMTAFMGSPNEFHIKKFHKRYPNSKFIFIDRDIKSIIATRCKRRPISKEFRYGSNDLITIFNSGEVEKLINYRNIIFNLNTLYPNIFLIVPFNELLSDTENIMKKVSIFLDIEYDSILTKFTYRGREVISNNRKYLEEELDKPEDILSKKELSLIDKRIKKYKKLSKWNTIKVKAKKIAKNVLIPNRIHKNS